MTARTARLTGVATALTLAAATFAGCGLIPDSAGTDKPGASAPTSPREALLLAVPDQKVGAFRFVIKGNENPASGVLDAPKKTFQIKLSHSEPDVDLTLTMTALVVEDNSWMKIAFTPADLPGLPKVPKKWMKLDPAKISDPDAAPLSYEDETDPGYAGLLVENAAGVTETGAGRYAGTTDLTRADEAEIVDDAAVKALGAKAKTVPFTATVDAQGHLTAMTVKIPAAGKSKARTYSISYSGFGGTRTPAAPAAGEQTAATAAVYELLNS